MSQEDEYAGVAAFVQGQPFSQETELGSVFRQMDDDSNVDRNTRLHKAEITGIMILDAVCNEFDCLPRDFAALSNRKKALNVSEGGKGRIEKVEMVKGDRARSSGEGWKSKLKSAFTPGGGQE